MSVLSFTNRNNLFPQALATGIQARLSRDKENALILNTVPVGRTAKRNTQQINYAEFDNYNEEFEQEESTISNQNQTSIIGNQITSSNQKIILKPARTTPSIKDLEDEMKPTDTSTGRNDVLIPIRLNIEYNNGNSRLVDFFMWDLNDTLLSPSQFATILCNDLDLPPYIHQEITDSISKQIEEYNFALTLQLPSNIEYHVVIDLAVSLNKKLYEDKFEWNLKQTDITPENFADIVVSDLGLFLEFKPAIAHALHEIVLRLKKEIVDGSYNYDLHKYQQMSGLIFERGIRIHTESSLQNGNDQWEPLVEILTPWEIEKRDIERERNIRRLKRENMRREVDDFGTSKRRALSGRRRHDESDWNF